MQKITKREIEAIFDLGVKVYQEEMVFAEAVGALQEKYSMNQSSARDYIANVGSILSGRIYKRTINAAAAEYFLDNIRRLFPNNLENAIMSIMQHVKYYRGVSNNKLPKLVSIVDNYTIYVNNLKQMNIINSELDEETENALSLSAPQRKIKAKSYSAKPKSILVITTMFIRNPYVRADVLLRASGSCEHCKKEGPFRSINSGEPYLEVHHRIPLAEGGDDTVANAIALCPSCHREAHFGIDKGKYRPT